MNHRTCCFLSMVFVGAFSVCLAQEKPVMPSVQAIMEKKTVRTLADGNTIERVTTTSYYRDSFGRTRLETSNSVAISDPVSRFAAILDPVTKTAQRIQLAPLPSAGGIKMMPSPKSTTQSESLGSKVIDGYMADGQSIRLVIPAQVMGNTRPIEQVQEVWFSRDLQLPILKRTIDPLNGEITEHFRSLAVLPEISADRFVIPTDYKVEQVSPSASRVNSGRPPNPTGN